MTQLNGLLAQVHKYSDYEKKPVSYSEKITYRYIIKHNRFNTYHQIDSSQVDTILNADGSIKSINKHYQETYSSADYQYPDSTLYEKQVYNEKGLLIYYEEPYHIHVDQPCMTKSYYKYDEHNREIEKETYECDTFFYRKTTFEFNDATHLVLEKYYDGKDEPVYYWSEAKFDSAGRMEKNVAMQWDRGMPDEWGRTEYFYEKAGSTVVGKIYERNKLDKINYWLYDKKGRLYSELICWPPDGTFDTLVNSRILFKYGRRGNLIQEKEEGSDMKSQIDYTYNKKNQMISAKEDYETENWDKKVEKTFYKYEYHYRKDGLVDYMDEFRYDGEQIRYRYQYKFKP